MYLPRKSGSGCAMLRSATLALMMFAAFAWSVQADCSGWLPGNCKFGTGQGYMMCNSEFCRRFGLPAQTNSCQSAELCDKMCEAAEAAGGSCYTDYIPWRFEGCVYVNVIRRQMIFPNMGPVNCDAKLGCGTRTCGLWGRCPIC